jgi:outer membrane protein OmpA-like peptidoglycan-associated protein
MHRNRLLAIGAASVIGLAACASQHQPPRSLVDARADLQRAKDGDAQRFDPTDVHEADLALQRAEQSFSDAPDDAITVDLAIIADRRALFAQSEAEAIRAKREADKDMAMMQKTTADQLSSAKGKLSQKDTELQNKDAQIQKDKADAAQQTQKLADLESKLKDARDTIAKIAAVKDDERGMVITLQGEVLFKTDKSDLKPGAMAKLDEIADALKGKEQPIVVYGFTDSTGTVDHNMVLSQQRAQAVRDYLVTKGILPDLVTAQGKGPAEPVADNTSVEGRAQNRRVEIVVKPNP